MIDDFGKLTVTKKGSRRLTCFVFGVLVGSYGTSKVLVVFWCQFSFWLIVVLMPWGDDDGRASSKPATSHMLRPGH